MKTLEKINRLQKFGSKLGLKRMNRLMDLLGDPHAGLNCIHVGGTNGKGSVCTYIYSMLRANGYSAGIFTSPFMEGFLESVIVDESPMTRSELDRNYKKIDRATEKMKKEGFDSPTEFEVITALAFLFFHKHRPDFVILEVGLGGIGDSTNVIEKPLASVITSVALDHCLVLGDTIEKIAHEKAGIIKRGVPVVANLTGAAAKVVAREAYARNAPLIDISKLKPTDAVSDTSGSRFSVKIDGIDYSAMSVSMVGAYQIENALCALTVIELLRKKALITLDADATGKGLKNARLKGRFEIVTVSQETTLIMDGAHNAQGAATLADTLEDFFPGKRILTVFTIMNDKAPEDMIREFSRFTDSFIVADMLSDKEVESGKLASLAGGDVQIVYEREKLLEIIQNIEDYDIILVTGSLYLIRDIRDDLLEMLVRRK